MEIQLVPIDGGASFEFPTLPSEVSVKNGAHYQSYSIIGLGSVKIPRGTEVEEISWDGHFFGPSKSDELMVGSYTSPKQCVQILEQFRDNGTKLRVMCSEIGINRDVTINSFQWTPYGAHGNVRYSISLAGHRELEVKVIRDAVTTVAPNSAADTPEQRPEPAPAATYTIVQGDTLGKIAQRFCGGFAAWTKIYDANASVIEAEAQKYGKSNSDHGHWIYPGCTLTIPS